MDGGEAIHGVWAGPTNQPTLGEQSDKFIPPPIPQSLDEGEGGSPHWRHAEGGMHSQPAIKADTREISKARARYSVLSGAWALQSLDVSLLYVNVQIYAHCRYTRVRTLADQKNGWDGYPDVRVKTSFQLTVQLSHEHK